MATSPAQHFAFNPSPVLQGFTPIHRSVRAKALVRSLKANPRTVAKAFLSFFDHTLREDCKPTFFVFFAAYQVIPYAKSKTHSASYFISSGQETSGIQLCLRLVSGDIHVTIRSFPSFCSFFHSSALLPSFASPKSRNKY